MMANVPLLNEILIEWKTAMLFYLGGNLSVL